MSRKSINSNKQFMIGNGILAFGVFFIVCLFLDLGFRYQKKQGPEEGTPVASAEIYTICLESSMSGEDVAVYINDSLLLKRTLANEPTLLQVNKFSDENALLIVNNRTDEVTPFNLSAESEMVSVNKVNGSYEFTATKAAK